MALLWIEHVRQPALIDEAEQLANRYLNPAFADVLALYREIGFDIDGEVVKLSDHAKEARQLRAQSGSAQVSYEAESAHARDAVKAAARWLEELEVIGRFARVARHTGTGMDRLLESGRLAAGSWSQATDSLGLALLQLPDSGLSRFGLKPDFTARGEAILASLSKERTDTDAPFRVRDAASERLQEVLGEIVYSFELISAARDAAMFVTGKEIPGLELTFVKGAAAPRTAPAEPAEGVASEPPKTGL
jgi:hypothetical protein